MLKQHIAASFSTSILSAWIGFMLTLGAALAATTQQEAEQKLAKLQAQIQKSQRKLEKDRGEVGQL